MAGTHQIHFLEISAKDGQESTLKLFQWMVDRKYRLRETDPARKLILSDTIDLMSTCLIW
jgi:hypothetical protein